MENTTDTVTIQATEENINAPVEQPDTAAANETAGEVIQLTKADFNKVKSHIEDVQKEKEAAAASNKKLKKNLEKAKAQVSELEQEKEEAIAIAQRLSADFDNYRKRNATLRTDSVEEGRRDCIKALLPVLDNFDRALSSAIGVDPAFLEGIQLLRKLFVDTLEKFGMEEIPVDGGFDPHLHNAVMQEAIEGKSAGEILEVLQKGYRMNGHVLRYSMVKVAE